MLIFYAEFVIMVLIYNAWGGVMNGLAAIFWEKKMNKKFLTIFLVCIILIIGLLSGCSNTATKEGREKFLKRRDGGEKADYVICEQFFNDSVFTLFRCRSGRLGLTEFKKNGDSFHEGSTSYVSPEYIQHIHQLIGSKDYDIFFGDFNGNNVSRIEATYKALSRYEQPIIKKVDTDGIKMFFVERPYVYAEILSTTYYDTQGNIVKSWENSNT